MSMGFVPLIHLVKQDHTKQDPVVSVDGLTPPFKIDNRLCPSFLTVLKTGVAMGEGFILI